MHLWHITLKYGKQKTVAMKKLGELCEGSIIYDFNGVKESNEADVFVEVDSKALIGALLTASDRTY